MTTEVSRRNFLKGAALLTAGGAVAGLAGCAPKSADGSSGGEASGASGGSEASVTWDAEYDVVVAGYGAAGAYAAISAAESGARVLLMEKADKAHAGGNSRFGQNYMAPTDRDLMVQFMANLRGEYNLISSDEIAEFQVDGWMTFYDWLIEHGVSEDVIEFATRPEYPELYPDEEFTGFRKITLRPDPRYNAQDVNAALGTLRDIVEGMKDSIDVWYSAPLETLIQDPETKIVHGVTSTIDGKRYNIRAINGVVLAVGGFENNQEMIQNYIGYTELLAKGCSFNTGDGIVAAGAVGAKMWHMTCCAAPDPNYKNPYTGCSFGWTCASGSKTPPNAWYGDMGQTSAIIVAGDGTRFVNEAANETRNSRHGQTNFHGTWTHMPWPSNTWMVFDEAARVDGHKPYWSWSDGLEQELELGWLVKGDTLAALGEQIGIDGEALAGTVERWNGICESGLDEDCGRDEGLVAIGDGPYYAFKLTPAVTNTDGGPQRNTDCQVIGWDDEPIPHLYSAGTCGSFWVGNYNGGGNMGENYVTGTTAGANAAAAKDDVSQESLLSGDAVNFADDYALTEFECADNQYIGRYWGMNDRLAVRVTIDGDTIENVEVVEHNETKDVGTLAINQLPQMIVEANSTAVDTISGATRTSAGIIIAVEQCLAEAGVEIKTHDAEVATLQ